MRYLSAAGKLVAIALLCHAALTGVIALEWLAYTIPSIAQSPGVQYFVDKIDLVDRLIAGVASLSFLFWWSRVFREAREARVKMLVRNPVASFFIPILNLFRPYMAIAELHRLTDAALLPEPPPEPVTVEHAHGYRESAAVTRASFVTPDAPLRLWWGLYLGRVFTNIADRLSGQREATLAYALVMHALELFGAAVTLLVVLRVSKRVRVWSQRMAEMPE